MNQSIDTFFNLNKGKGSKRNDGMMQLEEVSLIDRLAPQLMDPETVVYTGAVHSTVTKHNLGYLFETIYMN